MVAPPRSKYWPVGGLRPRLSFAVFGRDGVGAVGELAELVVAEEDGIHGPQAEEELEGEVADLALRVRVGPHLDDVPEGPYVTRKDHRGLGLVRQERARCLLHLLAGVGLVRSEE